MKIARTLPPTAALIYGKELFHGLCGMFKADYVPLLSDSIQRYFGANHVYLLNSGKGALTLILRALHEISGRRKVLIPAYTCFTVPSAIKKAGLEIVPCDIDPRRLDLIPEEAERLIDEDTLCVVPTHLFGIQSDVDRIKTICEGSGTFVVEDAAQAMGVTDRGRKLGTLGEVGFFSLGRGKNITSVSGGIIITNSDEIAEQLDAIYSELPEESTLNNMIILMNAFFMKVFINPSLYWFPAGLPFLKLGETRYFHDFSICKMGGARAGLLKGWVSKLERENRERGKRGNDYVKGLGQKASVTRGREGLPYLRFPLIVDSREIKRSICSSSEGMKMGISPFYPSSVTGIKELYDELKQYDCSGADSLAGRLVTLPTHRLINESDVKKILTLIRGYNK